MIFGARGFFALIPLIILVCGSKLIKRLDRKRRQEEASTSLGEYILEQAIGWLVFGCIFVCIWRGAEVYGNSGKPLFSSADVPSSTIVREKIETDNAYINDCVEDNIHWINNESKLETDLRYFYNKTGVQPYIILRQFDATIQNEDDASEWATTYYDENLSDRQDVFLFVYFNDAQDSGTGYSAYAMGKMTGAIMDSEALEICWGYLDYDWEIWDTDDNDGMFVDVFSKTAYRIMKVSTTTKDIVIVLVIGVVVVSTLSILFIWWTKKRKAEKERAQETIDILNAGKDQRLYEDSNLDEIAHKYDE